MKKNIKKHLTRAFVLVFVVLLFVCLPLFKMSYEDEFSQIFGAFVGSKSKYQGVLVVWNIDSFESGTASKSKYIESVAKSFEKQNKGTYVLVRNLSEYKCLSLLQKGEVPDLFSCSYAVAKKIRDHVVPFSNFDDIEIDKKLLEAGKVENELMALAWARGIYCLITTSEKLSLAGKTLENGQRLSSIALTSNYVIKKKDSEKKVASLCYGAGGVLLPQIAFSTYTDSGLEFLSTDIVPENSVSCSQYSAYASFLAGESTILLGTQRDIARMENRVKNGKASDLIYEPLYSKCDLVQFCLIGKTENNLRQTYAESFARSLVSKKQQVQIEAVGMIPVCSGLNPYSSGIMKDIVAQISEDYVPFKIFE